MLTDSSSSFWLLIVDKTPEDEHTFGGYSVHRRCASASRFGRQGRVFEAQSVHHSGEHCEIVLCSRREASRYIHRRSTPRQEITRRPSCRTPAAKTPDGLAWNSPSPKRRSSISAQEPTFGAEGISGGSTRKPQISKAGSKTVQIF